MGNLLRRIKSPTLVIAGKHDKSTPLEGARFIQENVSGAALEVLDAAHISNIEQAAKFTSAIVAFLSERPARQTEAASTKAHPSA